MLLAILSFSIFAFVLLILFDYFLTILIWLNVSECLFIVIINVFAQLERVLMRLLLKVDLGSLEVRCIKILSTHVLLQSLWLVLLKNFTPDRERLVFYE